MQKSNWIYSTHLNFPIFCASFYCAWVCIYTDTQTHTGKIWNTSKPPHWMTAIYKGKYLLNIYSLCFFYPASTIFASLTQAMPCKLEWSRKTQRKIERERSVSEYVFPMVYHAYCFNALLHILDFSFYFSVWVNKKVSERERRREILKKKAPSGKGMYTCTKRHFWVKYYYLIWKNNLLLCREQKIIWLKNMRAVSLAPLTLKKALFLFKFRLKKNNEMLQALLQCRW